MNKLWRFKRYLTLDDVADYLSSTFNDEVQHIDVERLLLDGHMAGSIVANDWHCFSLKHTDTSTKVHDEVRDKLTSQEEVPHGDPDEIINGPYRVDLAELESNREYITIELKSGCKAACYTFDNSKYKHAIKDSKIEANTISNSPDPMNKFNRLFDALPKIMDTNKKEPTYAKPRVGIENLVVQQRDLEDFIAKVNDDQPEKALDYRERANMERIILALAKEAGYDLNTPYTAAEALEASAATTRVPMPSSTETISKYLKAAAKHDTYNK